jgi:hypothetical protein
MRIAVLVTFMGILLTRWLMFDETPGRFPDLYELLYK